MIDGQLGTSPLNGCDARALLGIVWGWLDSAREEGATPEDLERELRAAGYRPLPSE